MKFVKIKIPKITDHDTYFKSNDLGFLLHHDLRERPGHYLSGNLDKNKDSRKNSKPHLPDLTDLQFLHKLITLNKRTTILEYGCGNSTLVMHDALLKNKKKYPKVWPRCAHPFRSYVVDNSRKYLGICKRKLTKFSKLNKLVSFRYSKVQMTTFNRRISNEYLSHPVINPDFILLDGPNNFTKIHYKKNGFHIGTDDLMPMNCDILKFEHFLTPGTIIVSDGRTANVRFLINNFQRNWVHIHLEKIDTHLIYLDEKPLGVYNKAQLDYYKK